MCEPECPNMAITYREIIYEIDSTLCTECIGHYEEPTCIKVCPIDCIIVDPKHLESEEQLMERFVLIHHSDKL